MVAPRDARSVGLPARLGKLTSKNAAPITQCPAVRTTLGVMSVPVQANCG
jgi:hypothetical protein